MNILREEEVGGKSPLLYCITTDNGPNIVAAVKKCNWIWLNCFKYNSNLGVTNSIKTKSTFWEGLREHIKFAKQLCEPFLTVVAVVVLILIFFIFLNRLIGFFFTFWCYLLKYVNVLSFPVGLSNQMEIKTNWSRKSSQDIKTSFHYIHLQDETVLIADFTDPLQ